MKVWLFSNFANFITAFRLIGSIWLAILINWERVNYFWLFFLLLICIFSDLIDGKLARKFSIESKTGAFLDRLADKIFVVLLLIILSVKSYKFISYDLAFLNISLVIVVILIEIILFISGIIGFLLKFDINANKWGKRKMIFQSLAIFSWLSFLFLRNFLRSGDLLMIKFIFYSSNLLLFFAILMAIKSLEGYFLRWKKEEEGS